MSPKTDILVIGSGIAGLSFALKAASYAEVTIITKRAAMDSSTWNAQGGIAAVMSREDSFEDHIRDTIRAGDGLCREDIVRLVVQEGPDRVRELLELGMGFSRDEHDEEQPFELGLEGGHSHRRILHAGDFTGSAVAQALFDASQRHKRIRLLEYHAAIDLITTRKLGLRREPNRCLGAYVLDAKTGEVLTLLARATVLAAGGAGKVYLYTSNPDVATGDGMAMAYRAGALLANMEFVQFHPTCLYHSQAKSFLISEALRGEGGILRLSDGRTFMKAYHPAAELAPRDVVARAIDHELKKTGADYVLLDVTHLGADFLRRRFPQVLETCARYGLDMTRDPIPVVPAAHYFCGGVWTDAHGATTVDRLYAIGETACTGLHGANRLASNSLLEGLVFAHRAALALKTAIPDTGASVPGTAVKVPSWNPGRARDSDEQVVIAHNWEEIRRLMWNYVGIVRTNKRLARALRRLHLLQQEIQEYYWDFLITLDLIELRNIALVADLVTRCAMARKESRGLHYNLDYPKRDDRGWKRDAWVGLGSSGSAALFKRPEGERVGGSRGTRRVPPAPLPGLRASAPGS